MTSTSDSYAKVDAKAEGPIARGFAVGGDVAWRLVLAALVGFACAAIAAPAALADEFEDDEPIVVSDDQEEDEVEDEEIDWARTGPYVLGMATMR